jgi:uncharacterized protein (TIGR03083 family)
MADRLVALHASVLRLRGLVEPLTPDQLVQSAYPSEWTIAQVLSHVGSGAVIFTRRITDRAAGRETDADFAPSVWDEWNAKSPEQQATDALVADAALLDLLETVPADGRAGFELAMGPMTFGFDEVVGLRLNEHALHTWDVEVSLEPDATLSSAPTQIVIDNLQMIAGFGGKPDGTERIVRIHTTDPVPDLELPAEAFIRLLYGRFDPDPQARPEGDSLLTSLRLAFPGI